MEINLMFEDGENMKVYFSLNQTIFDIKKYISSISNIKVGLISVFNNDVIIADETQVGTISSTGNIKLTIRYIDILKNIDVNEQQKIYDEIMCQNKRSILPSIPDQGPNFIDFGKDCEISTGFNIDNNSSSSNNNNNNNSSNINSSINSNISNNNNNNNENNNNNNNSTNNVNNKSNNNNNIISSKVHSLRYVNIKVNDVVLKALIDCGSQISLISSNAVRKCNLENMIDTKKIAELSCQGSTTTTSGLIHSAPFQIGLANSSGRFRVLTNLKDDCILGIDWLIDNKIKLDFQNDNLIINDLIIKMIFRS